MGLTYNGALGSLQRGNELAETGIGIVSIVVRYFPRIIDRHENNLGEIDGRVISTVASREITIEGEVTGTTGRMTDVFISATTTIANDVADFGSPTGGIYLMEATVTQRRASWRSVSLRYESDPGLA